MRFLLDTHTLLWCLYNEQSLSQEARTVITNRFNQFYVSAASIWEIRIKQQLDRLEGVPDNIYEIIQQQPVELLSISAEHANTVGILPMYHRDPFDRILIAQCMVEKLTLVTRDEKILKYGISILKA